jgi:hypothetical protein
VDTERQILREAIMRRCSGEAPSALDDPRAVIMEIESNTGAQRHAAFDLVPAGM